jgi:hypothetical protein
MSEDRTGDPGRHQTSSEPAIAPGTSIARQQSLRAYGATDALMRARGFTRRTLAGLVRAELATARHEIVKAGDKTTYVGRVRITTAGPRAVEG